MESEYKNNHDTLFDAELSLQNRAFSATDFGIIFTATCNKLSDTVSQFTADIRNNYSARADILVPRRRSVITPPLSATLTFRGTSFQP
jgi:hypothetical protein